MWLFLCAIVKTWYICYGHPSHNWNPYNWFINPYQWIDDHPRIEGIKLVLTMAHIINDCIWYTIYYHVLSYLYIYTYIWLCVISDICISDYVDRCACTLCIILMIIYNIFMCIQSCSYIMLLLCIIGNSNDPWVTHFLHFTLSVRRGYFTNAQSVRYSCNVNLVGSMGSVTIKSSPSVKTGGSACVNSFRLIWSLYLDSLRNHFQSGWSALNFYKCDRFIETLGLLKHPCPSSRVWNLTSCSLLHQKCSQFSAKIVLCKDSCPSLSLSLNPTLAPTCRHEARVVRESPLDSA